MRFVFISDSHTRNNLQKIYDFLMENKWKPDGIIINGDILGEHEVREGYGYGYNKTIFEASLDKKAILRGLAPDIFDNLIEITQYYEQQLKQRELTYSQSIKQYIELRYEHLLDALRKFSKIARVYFNLGTIESPLHYDVIEELAYLIDVPVSVVRHLASLADYRHVFSEFSDNLKKEENIIYLGHGPALHKELMIIGIPGFHKSTHGGDSQATFEEKHTQDILNSALRKLSFCSKILLTNPIQAKLKKEPFSFRPASMAVRAFLQRVKKPMIYVQSYYHLMITHFYQVDHIHFMLNNAAVNNGLFNVIDIGRKISAYDVDPQRSQVTQLTSYHFKDHHPNTPPERLALNYEHAQDIIDQRKLKGCVYL